MKFLDPKNDIAFKKIFGDEHHKNLTINFLNNVLDLPKSRLIKDVTFYETEKLPDRIKGKRVYFDVYCVDEQDNRCIIEMQLLNEYNFVERSEYYLSRALLQQLDKGDAYQNLLPVIFLGIVNYQLFDDLDHDKNHVMSHYSMRNDVTGKPLNKSRFALHYIELSKFTKSLDQLENFTDRWFYFLKNAKDLESVPEPLQDLQEAFNILDTLQWNDADLADYSKEQEIVDRERRQQEGAMLQIAQEKAEKLVVKLLQRGSDIDEIVDLAELSIEQIEIVRKKYKI